MTPNSNTPLFPTNAQTITPSDTASFPPGAVYVGGAGNVAVRPADGPGPVTFVGVPAGAMVPVLCTAVLATGTSATNLVLVR